MKRLVIIGEGHGEVSALPLLAKKILLEKKVERRLWVDEEIVRAHNPSGLVKWDREKKEPECGEWLKRIRFAANRSNLGGILAIFDGDAERFPAGAQSAFCAKTAAKLMAKEAAKEGAGTRYSLAIVFACVEYESWLIAGAESLAGKTFKDGRPILPKDSNFPDGPSESHGKRWLEKHCLSGYRSRRDQGPLTELVDLAVVRSKGLRSFFRLDHAIEQILDAVDNNVCIVTP